MFLQKFVICKTFITCLAQMCLLQIHMNTFVMNSQILFDLIHFATFFTWVFFVFITGTFVVRKIRTVSTFLAFLFKMWYSMQSEFMLHTSWKWKQTLNKVTFIWWRSLSMPYLFFKVQCRPSMSAQKEVLRYPSGIPQESLRNPTGSPQEVLRKPSGSPQEALRKP